MSGNVGIGDRILAIHTVSGDTREFTVTSVRETATVDGDPATVIDGKHSVIWTGDDGYGHWKVKILEKAKPPEPEPLPIGTLVRDRRAADIMYVQSATGYVYIGRGAPVIADDIYATERLARAAANGEMFILWKPEVST